MMKMMMNDRTMEYDDKMSKSAEENGTKICDGSAAAQQVGTKSSGNSSSGSRQ